MPSTTFDNISGALWGLPSPPSLGRARRNVGCPHTRRFVWGLPSCNTCRARVAGCCGWKPLDAELECATMPSPKRNPEVTRMFKDLNKQVKLMVKALGITAAEAKQAKELTWQIRDYVIVQRKIPPHIALAALMFTAMETHTITEAMRKIAQDMIADEQKKQRRRRPPGQAPRRF